LSKSNNETVGKTSGVIHWDRDSCEQKKKSKWVLSIKMKMKRRKVVLTYVLQRLN